MFIDDLIFSGVIQQNFQLGESNRQELLAAGCFSVRDIEVVERFIQCLASCSDEASGDSIPEDSNKGNLELNGKEDLLKAPPYCLVFGDFQRCLEFCIKKHRESNLPPPTVNQIWKELRRSIHCCVRSLFPFLFSETLELTQISASPELLTELHMPGFKSSIPGNSFITQRLEEVRAHVNRLLENHSNEVASCESEVSVDQFSRAIRVSPKLPCLLSLFQSLRRKRQQSRHQALSDCHDSTNNQLEQPSELVSCRCNKRKRNRKQKKRAETAIDGNKICKICKGLINESRVVPSHFDRWPKDRPPYLYFHLWKSNRDTAEALNSIAQCLGCGPKTFSFGGTKDKRAVTVQAVTAFKVSIEQMHKALLHPRWDNKVLVSDLRYVDNRLCLGSIQGNHFRVCLRNVSPDAEDAVKEACESLKHNGYINYFGLQRFGTRTIRTHEVGAAILRGDFKAAVRLILGDVHQLEHYKKTVAEESEQEEDAKRRKVESEKVLADHSLCVSYLVTGDPAAALRFLPRHCYIERQILKSLVEDGSNYLRALQQLPKNTFSLHVHAGSVQNL